MPERPRARLQSALVLAILVLTVPFAGAAAQSLYTIDEVLIDERAASEVDAKQNGIAQAKRDAFHRLLERLTLSPDQQAPTPLESTDASGGLSAQDVPDGATVVSGDSALATGNTALGADGAVVVSEGGVPVASVPPAFPDDSRLETMIRDISFQDERFGGGRYLAELTIRFNADAVNTFLERSGTAYLGGPSPRMVVLPIFRQDGSNILWSDLNPWLGAWSELDRESLIVPHTVPLGDLADIGAIDAERALAVDAASINAIGARYRAGAVAILIASLDAETGLQVEVATFGSGWPTAPELVRVSRQEGYDAAMAMQPEEDVPAVDEMPEILPDEDVLLGAASIILDSLETRWKRENILRFDQETANLSAEVSLTGLEDWLSVRSILSTVPPVRSWRLVELSTTRAVLEIDYVGDTDRLAQGFARAALSLVPGGDGPEDRWLILR